MNSSDSDSDNDSSSRSSSTSEGSGAINNVLNGSKDIKSGDGTNILSDSGSDTSEDNFDDANYYKKMCPGFVKSIKDKNERIRMYKNMVFNSNLELVKMNSNYKRKLRNILKSGEKKNSQQNTKNIVGSDPLNVFPKEVWTMLLTRMIPDTNDLISLSRTCTLFQEILNTTKTDWLFGKTFPFLFNHLSKNDVLQIRLVSKKWLSSVDEFLENYCLRPTYRQLSTGHISQVYYEDNHVVSKKFQFDYHFILPFPIVPEDPTRNKNKFVDDMCLHETNPFIGRSIVIVVKPQYYQGMENWQYFSASTDFFFEKFGRHIFHLSITICRSDSLTSCGWWDFVILILTLCKNLKSFKIFGNLNWRIEPAHNIVEPFPEEISRLTSLECLKVDMYHMHIGEIQDQLVETFSRNLLRFEVQDWEAGNVYDYHEFDWGKLRELKINTENYNENLNSLLQTERMGNLRKLSICLNTARYVSCLENIVALTKHFKKLNHLALDFSEDSGETFESFCEERLVPGVVAGNELTTLELDSGLTEKIVCFDFLAYFPYLNRLTIKHQYNNKNHRMSTSRQDDMLNEKNYDANPDGILKFEKYLAVESLHQSDYDFKRKFYGKSNIWKFLPFLQIFTVVNCRRKVKHVFTRQGYEYFWRKRKQSEEDTYNN